MTAAISIRGLGKRYRLGETLSANTLRDQLADGVGAMRRRLVGRGNGEGEGTRSNRGASRGEFWALKDVDLDVAAGEVLGIIGRNGAGKSTLLKILSQITEPTAGEVRIHGRIGSLLEVGTGFHPELTGRENIYLNGAILGMRRAQILKRFDEIVGFAGVETFIDTPVKRYSSGMYVRLAFAVAAHLEPDILVVDEVLAVGDAEFQKRCLGKLEEVGDSGRTVILVSHNMETIARLCAKTAVIESGKVAPPCKSDEAIERYLREASPQRGENRCLIQDPVRSVLISADGKEGGTGHVVWGPREIHTIEIGVIGARAIKCPAVDLACFTSTEAKAFACCSDENVALPEEQRMQWSTTFTLASLHLSPGRYYFDVGVRDRGLRFGTSELGKPRYLAHWKRMLVAEVIGLRKGVVHTRESIICGVSNVRVK